MIHALWWKADHVRKVFRLWFLIRFLYWLPKVTALTSYTWILTKFPAVDQTLLLLGGRRGSALGAWVCRVPRAAPGQSGEGRSPLPWAGSDLWHILHALLGCLTTAGSWWAVSWEAPSWAVLVVSGLCAVSVTSPCPLTVLRWQYLRFHFADQCYVE